MRDHVARPTFLDGYVLRDSKAGKKLFELLKDGGEQRLTLSVRLVGPDGAAIPSGLGDHMVEITGAVKDSWAPGK